MDIKILEVHLNEQMGNNLTIGWVKVELASKMTLWMNIFYGKGGYYIKMPATRVNGTFVDSVAWINKDMRKQISEAIMEELRKQLPRRASQD